LGGSIPGTRNYKKINMKQTSIDWFFEQLVLNKIIIWNQTTYNVKYKYEIFLEQAREMYQDEIEAAAIISSAEQSTSDAHKKEIHRQQIIAAYKKGWEECNNLKYLPATYYEITYNTK
jgi:hypothetical protein